MHKICLEFYFDHRIYYLQAFKNHKLHDPLKDPGLADITADVDFAFLRRAVEDTREPGKL